MDVWLRSRPPTKWPLRTVRATKNPYAAKTEWCARLELNPSAEVSAREPSRIFALFHVLLVEETAYS
jgi:hypothetical protein